MRKQIIGILTSILMLLPTIGPMILTSNQNVKATATTGNIGLDNEKIYSYLENLSYVVFDEDLEDHGIRKGRDFGTEGDWWSAEQIRSWMENNSVNLTGSQVTKEPIGYYNSPSDQFRPKKSDIIGFQLLLKNGTYPAVPISTNESMAVVSKSYFHYIIPKYYTTSDFCTIERYNPSEDENNYPMFNVTYTRINDPNNFSQIDIDDELVAIENYSNASAEEIEGRIHLLNVTNEDLNDTVEIIANANATGFILIRNDITDIQGWEFPLTGVAVSEENGTIIKSYIENESIYNVSAATPDPPIPEQGNLTIYYFNASAQNEEKKIWLVDINDNVNKKDLNKASKHPSIVGILWYNSSSADQKTHRQLVPTFNAPYSFFGICMGSKIGIAFQPDGYSGMKKPWIYINQTITFNEGPRDIGEWVDTWNIKAKFWLNWTNNPNEIGYNVYCTVPGKDQTKTVIISGGHYDGFWGQMATDDASGVATMLGLLKYMNDHHITPKYNLIFITFSGEEYIDVGSRGYVLRHWNDITESKIVCILNADVLAHDTPDSKLYIHCYDRLQWLNELRLKNVVTKIAEITNYETRTSYSLVTAIPWKRWEYGLDWPIETLYPNTDAFPFWLRDISCINFGKEPYTVIRHQTGANHTLGDVMTHIDQNDLNISAELFYNVSRYFSIDPDCHFNSDITYQTTDSDNDDNEEADAVTIIYAIKTTMPSDHVKVRAILTSHDHPILGRYSNVATHVVTDTTTTYHTLTVPLPTLAPPGDYSLTVYLYNSTGEIDNILDNSYDQGIFANDSLFVDTISLTPPNDPPGKPSAPCGPTNIDPWLPHVYSTSTTDPNDDRIRYQWQWTEGHNDNWQIISWQSGATAWGLHSWLGETGSIQIRVRARDIWSHPDFCSPWSDPLTITVADGCWFDAPVSALRGQSVQFVGYVAGGTAPYTWAWKFAPTFEYENKTQTTNHTYTTSNTYPVSLKVTDSQNTTMYYNTSIQIKNVIANYTANQTDAISNTSISFNDTSMVYQEYHATNWTWDFGDGTTSYDRNTTHVFITEGDYNVTLTIRDNQSHTDMVYQIIHIDSTRPEILAVKNTENTVAQGFPMTINAELFDNRSDINTIKINITNPDNTTGNYSMEFTETGLYSYIYSCSNTEQLGQYNYTIWVTDHAGNNNNTTGFSFIVVQQPYLRFITPTPENNIVYDHNWVHLNTTVQDTQNTSAFIDWNYTLKGYWSMDTYNTTGVHDNSTYDNFGVFNSGLSTSNIVNAKYGKGLDFDGNDDYLDLGTNTSLDLEDSDFTFMVWEKSDISSYSEKAMILTNSPVSENWKGYGFGVVNRTYLFVSQSSGHNVTVQGVADVTDSTWHHIAYVKHDGGYYIYVDGAFDAQSILTSEINITNTQHTCLAYDGHASNWCYFDGMLDEPQLYNRALSREEINASYNNGLYRLYHNFTGLTDGTYHYYAHAINTTGNQGITETRQVTIDSEPPTITSVSDNPDTVGFGFNVTISATVQDNVSGVKTVKAQISYPGTASKKSNFTMTNINNDTYQYIFSDTWLVGQYNYTIWATDNSNNTASSSQHHFHVSANATITVCTLQNGYTNNDEYINLTDPPADVQDFGIPLLDGAEVIVTENNTSLTVDNGDGFIWRFSKNPVYDATIYHNDAFVVAEEQWYLEYRKNNNQWSHRGEPISLSYEQDAPEHLIVTRSYTDNQGTVFGVTYDFTGGLRTKISCTGTLGRSDVYRLVWTARGINTNHIMANQDNHQVKIWNDDDVDQVFSFDCTDVFDMFGDITQVTVDQSANNHAVQLIFNLGARNTGGFYLDPSFGYNGTTTGNYDINDKLAGFVDTCLTNGTADSMTVALVGWNSGEAVKCVLYEKYNSTHYMKIGETEQKTTGGSNSWHTFNFIGTKPIVTKDTEYWLCAIANNSVFARTRAGWLGRLSHAQSHVYESELPVYLDPANDYSGWAMGIYCNYTPIIQFQNPSPANGTMNVSISPTLGITVSDIFGSTMNLTWYSNSSGSWQLFDMNNSVGNGTYHQVFTNASENGRWWYWCVHVDDGTYSEESAVYRFYTGRQSKLVNTGSTNISGYLLIQIQYNNSGTWVVDNDTVDETTPRTIGVGSQLALDTIFNGLVKTNDLTHGDGLYRVYAAFRDSDGDVLVCDNATKLEAAWEFNHTTATG